MCSSRSFCMRIAIARAASASGLDFGLSAVAGGGALSGADGAGWAKAAVAAPRAATRIRVGARRMEDLPSLTAASLGRRARRRFDPDHIRRETGLPDLDVD